MPPESAAAPVTVTADPAVKLLPEAGEVIIEVGAVWSVAAVAATIPVWREPGCAPISANRLTVACCMGTLGVVDWLLWVPSRPQDHWIVPAPNTSAPLAAR